MRCKIEPQGRLSFRRASLKVTNEYYKRYEDISSILDGTPEILAAVHKDLEKPLGSTSVKDAEGRRCRFTSNTVLRALVVMRCEGLSLRQVTIRIDDSEFLREFIGIYDGPMLDYSTLCRLRNSIRPDTWKRVNELLARYAVDSAKITGAELRLDTTAVETDIHHPTDSALLWDVYRVLARWIERARELHPDLVGTKRLHKKQAKRLATKISRLSRRKKPRASLQEPYEALISRVSSILEWAWCLAPALRECPKAMSVLDAAYTSAIAQELETYVKLGARVIDQAQRRILLGEQVPNDEKIFSIFETHTELLKRGKVNKEIEYGHMIQIQQVPEKFITDYSVFEKKPVEHTLLKQAIESHKSLFGKYPEVLAGDKGYYKSMAALAKVGKKVRTVAIGKKGKRTTAETEREHDAVFKKAQRFRAGVEGTISFLKRCLRLDRCLPKGLDHFIANVGIAVFAHNLLKLAGL